MSGYHSSGPPKAKRGCKNGACHQPYVFKQKSTEKLFQDYAFPLRRASLATILGVYILLTAVLAILYFSYQKAPTENNIFHIVLCLFGISFYIFINTRFLNRRKQLIIISYMVWILLLLLAFISLPLGSWTLGPAYVRGVYPSQGLWQYIFIIYCMYLIMALNFYMTLIFGLVLSFVHTTVLLIRLEDYKAHWVELMVNIVILLVTNGVGILIHHVVERTQRKSFINCRAYIGAKVECEDQGQKLVKLAEICLPKFMCPEVCADLTMYNFLVCPRNVFPKLYDCISMACINIVGLHSIQNKMDASEFVSLVNDICSTFEGLCQQNNCLPLTLRGDTFSAVSGVPSPDPDGAQACVNLCFDIMQAVQMISQTRRVELDTLTGVHYGSIATGVVGVFRWRYKATSNDLLLAKHVAQTGVPGRVHITDPCIRFLALDQFEIMQTAMNQGVGFPTYLLSPLTQRKPCAPLLKLSRRISRQASTTSFLQQETLVMENEEPFYRHLSTANNDSRSNITNCLLEGKAFVHRLATTCPDLMDDVTNRSFQDAIWSGTVEAESSRYINFFSLFFTEKYMEKSFRKEIHGFGFSLTFILILLIALSLVHFALLPRTILLLGSNLLIFLFISILLILLLATKLKVLNCKCYTQQSFNLAMLLTVVLLISVSALLNVISCRGSSFYDAMPVIFKYGLIGDLSNQSYCNSPDYIYISGIIVLFMVSILRVSHLIQAGLLILITGSYAVIAAVSHGGLYAQHDVTYREGLPPSGVLALVALLHFALLHILMVRHYEWLRRLNYIWKHKETHETQNAHDMVTLRQGVANNCLPTHVMKHYLSAECVMRPYSQSHNLVGIAVVSVPNFSVLINDMFRLGQPNSLIQTLHDVTSAFDHLVKRGDFQVVEKVHSNDLTFLFVSGLNENLISLNQPQFEQDYALHHLCKLLDLLLDMRHCLHQLNAMSGRNLVLRAGVSMGPVVEGIFGYKRPQYNIWGPPVDSARKLEAAGKMNFVQTTKDVAQLLRRRFQFQARTNSGVSADQGYIVMGRRLQSVIASDNVSIASQSSHQQAFGQRNISVGSISQAETVIVSSQPPYLNRPIRTAGDNLGYHNNSGSSTPADTMKHASSNHSFRDPNNWKMPQTPSMSKLSINSRPLSPELPAVHYTKMSTPPASQLPSRDSRGTIILTQASLSGRPSATGLDGGAEVVIPLTPTMQTQTKMANIVSTDSINRSFKRSLSQLSPVGEKLGSNYPESPGIVMVAHRHASNPALGLGTPSSRSNSRHGSSAQSPAPSSTHTVQSQFSFPPPLSPPRPARSSPAASYTKRDTSRSSRSSEPRSIRSEARSSPRIPNSKPESDRMIQNSDHSGNATRDTDPLLTQSLIQDPEPHVLPGSPVGGKPRKGGLILGLDRVMTTSAYSDRMQTSMEGNASSESSPEDPLISSIDYSQRMDGSMINDDPTLSPILKHQLNRFAKKADLPRRSPHLSRKTYSHGSSGSQGAICSLASPTEPRANPQNDFMRSPDPLLSPKSDSTVKSNALYHPLTSTEPVWQGARPKVFTQPPGALGNNVLLTLPPPPPDTATESELSDDDNEKVHEQSATDYDNMYSTDYGTYNSSPVRKIYNNKNITPEVSRRLDFLHKIERLTNDPRRDSAPSREVIRDLYRSEAESDVGECDSIVGGGDTDYESEAYTGAGGDYLTNPLQSLQRAEHRLMALLRPSSNLAPSTMGSSLRHCRSMELLASEDEKGYNDGSHSKIHSNRSSVHMEGNMSALSSMFGSEYLSRSEPDLSDCGGTVYDSEYDNKSAKRYLLQPRPTASQHQTNQPIRDIDLNHFDDIDFDKIKINETMTTLDYITSLQQQIDRRQRDRNSGQTITDV